MKRLWTEEMVTHRGKFYQVENTVFGPHPVQSPHPPIWMGGGADTVLRRVARLADGYICGSSAIQEFPSLWEKISGFAREAGRDPQKIEKGALTFMCLDDNKARAVEACSAYLIRYYEKVRIDVEKHLLVGSAEMCAERISSFLQKGLDTLIIGQVTPDLRQLDIFGEKVLPMLNP